MWWFWSVAFAQGGSRRDVSPFAWGTVMVEANVIATTSVDGLANAARLHVVDVFRGRPPAEIDVKLPMGPNMRPGDRVYVSLAPSANLPGAFRYAGTFLRRIEGRTDQLWAMDEELHVLASVGCSYGFGTARSDVSGFGLDEAETVSARIAEAEHACGWSAAMAAIRACASSVAVRP